VALAAARWPRWCVILEAALVWQRPAGTALGCLNIGRDSLLWDFANRAPGAGESRMRTFIFALAAIVPAFAIDWARAADEVPEFDIARNCKAETSDASIEGAAHCAKDETDAKNQLGKPGLPIARHRRRSASARALPEARRATSNF
jgi:hypothetical protein